MKELIKAILEDGVVDATEVAQLKAAIYDDGQVDKAEADAVFEINDKVTGKDNAPEWTSLFVKVVSDYVLEDETTPGVVDSAEGDYIVAKIGADGQVDDAEKALLLNIKNQATSIESESLNALIAKI